MKIYSTPNYDLTTTYSNMGRGRKQSDQSSPSVTQLIGMVRLGQSIFESTGLSMTAQYQWNIQKESRYLVSEYGSISDDAIFDDHYGYEGLQVSAMITQVLPFDARVRLIAGVQNKTYSNLAAYDLVVGVLSNQRKDVRSTYTINFTKEFESLNISLNVAYEYIVNSSNDPFYHYSNHAISVYLAFGL